MEKLWSSILMFLLLIIRRNGKDRFRHSINIINLYPNPMWCERRMRWWKKSEVDSLQPLHSLAYLKWTHRAELSCGLIYLFTQQRRQYDWMRFQLIGYHSQVLMSRRNRFVSRKGLFSMILLWLINLRQYFCEDGNCWDNK